MLGALTESDRLETDSWQLSTRKVNLTRGSQNSPERHRVLPNGFYLTADLSASEASFTVETEQGDFTFTAKARSDLAKLFVCWMAASRWKECL